MRFLVDAQLPPAVARWLTERGHEAVHVFDIGMGHASDDEIWNQAANRGAAIVTKDEDFVTLRLARTQGPAILWIRLGNTRRSALLAALEPLMPALIEALQRGETLIEIV
jgi:predicted nuclease of predicted toxin-antitoxin system